MRRTVCSVLTAMLMSVMLTAAAGYAETISGYTRENGYDYIELGTFMQGVDGEMEPILWRVLEADEQEAYLMSEYVLFSNRVHVDDKAYIAFDADFKQTDLYALLNGPFTPNPVDAETYERLLKKQKIGYEQFAQEAFCETAFTEWEQSLIVEDDELGRIYLASKQDLANPEYGFYDKESRKGYGTPYALAHGLFRYGNGSSPYWMRTRSDSKAYGTNCTKVDGAIGYIRCVVMNEGCRPVMRIDLSRIGGLQGDGTKDAPYVPVKGE